MYQIFYIDIDEEITSVIDRLKKSKAAENFFVVSPRSLILQSVVSLKLLKREAAKEKKQIAIVVNDKNASTKIEKSGILVLSSLKGLEGGDEIKENFSSKIEIENSASNKDKYKNIMEKEKSSKKTRLQKIGTDGFFKGETLENKTEAEPVVPARKTRSRVIKPSVDNDYKETIPSEPKLGMDGLGPKNISDVNVKRGKASFSYTPENNFEETVPAVSRIAREYRPNKNSSLNGVMDPYKEKIVEGFFNPEAKRGNFQENAPIVKKKIEKNIPVSHGMKKIIYFFAAICFLIVIGIAGYLFIPKAIVSVSMTDEVKKFDLSVKSSTAQNGISDNDLSIPGRIVEKELSMTNSYKTTGKKGSSSDISQKAKGKITIYNNYDQESQQLVASTRFLSADGKLFRLVKSATVPGMKGSDPGSVEADVIADQAGSEYNIDASDFKIPGFEGTPKYDKFYAKSSLAMSGGGTSGSGGIAIVSQSDIDGAKKDSEKKIKDQLEEEVKNEIGSGNNFMYESAEETISESASTAKLNTVADSFDYKVTGKIKTIVFSENDIKKLAGDNYNDLNKERKISDYSSIKINYGASSADFNSGSLNLKISAEVPIDSSIDWNDFKKNILGKDEGQIKEVLKNYPQIDKINIDFWPTSISQKIPQYESRVVIEVKNGSK